MKIGALPVLCIGGAIGAVCWGFGYFRFWMPNLDTANKTADAAKGWEDNAAKYPAAAKNYRLAQQLVREKELEWQEIVKVKTPPDNIAGGGIDLGVDAWHLVNDTFKFRDSIQKAVNRQAKYGGVKAITPVIDAPPVEATRIMSDYYNYPAVPYPVVMWNLGQVQVTGSYEQILANARSWKSMPNYLAMSDGLQIQGTGSVLTGTYNLVLVGYLRGKEIYPIVPEAGGTGGPGGGGGGRGPGGGGNAPNSGKSGPR